MVGNEHWPNIAPGYPNHPKHQTSASPRISNLDRLPALPYPHSAEVASPETIISRRGLGLESATGIALLVNVAEALVLLAVLCQAGRGEDQHAVDAAHAKDGGEDVVDEDVGETRDRGRAPAHQGRRRRAGAGSIGDEGRRSAVEVATAVEL